MGFEMAEKNVNRQTNKQTFSYLYKKRCNKCSYLLMQNNILNLSKKTLEYTRILVLEYITLLFSFFSFFFFFKGNTDTRTMSIFSIFDNNLDYPDSVV